MTIKFNPTVEMQCMEDDPQIQAATVYSSLLAQCPIARADMPNAKVDYWGAYGYKELQGILKNYKGMSSTVGTDEDGLPTIVPLFADPPYHTSFRKLLNPNFTEEVVGRIEEDIRGFAKEMVGELVEQGDVDFFESFAAKFPTRVLCRFLGVPDEDWPIHYAFAKTVDESSEGVSVDNPTAPFDDNTLNTFIPYVKRVIVDHRQNNRQGLITGLINGKVGDRFLEDDELIRLIIAIMLAGHATTTASISNFVLRLASDRKMQDYLRANPDRIGDALEEGLRMDAPQQSLMRKCVIDTEVGGELIKAGDFVLTNYGSANVDPNKFANPENFDIERAGKGHLSFGFGIHQCLGQHLARLDMRIAIEELLEKTSSIEVNGPVKRRTFPVLSAIQLPLRLEKRNVVAIDKKDE